MLMGIWTDSCTDRNPPDLSGWLPCNPLEIGNVDIGDVDITTPVVVTPPCQPCIAIGGVVDPTAFFSLIDGVVTVFNSTGPVATGWQILDPCDPRCAPESCPPTLTDCDGN